MMPRPGFDRCWRRACAASGLALVCTLPVLAQGIASGSTQITPRVLGAAPTMAPGRVEVYASSSMYIANAGGAPVYRVDARQQLHAEINRGGPLPANPQQAQLIAMQRMRANRPALEARTREVVDTLGRVLDSGITRVPAVVIDRQRVVYGVTDVAVALQLAAQGRSEPLGPSRRPGSGGQRSTTP